MRDRNLLMAGEKLKFMVSFILLLMILSRLTWLQIRTIKGNKTQQWTHGLMSNCTKPSTSSVAARSPDDLNYLPSASELLGYSSTDIFIAQMPCSLSQRLVKHLPSINHLLLYLIILLLVICAKSLTGSWVISIFISAVLMSRGSLLSNVNEVSYDLFLTFLLTIWVSSSVHFIRTGATFSLLGCLLAMFIASLVDLINIALCLVFPLFIFMQSRMNKSIFVGSQAMTRGSVFKSLKVPFLKWVMSSRRYINLNYGWLTVFLFALFFLIQIKLGLMKQMIYPLTWQVFASFDSLESIIFTDRFYLVFSLWLKNYMSSVDLHFLISLIFLCISLRRNFATLTSFYEVTWVIVLSLCVLFFFSFFYSSLIIFGFPLNSFSPELDRKIFQVNYSQIFVWFEPTVLCFGIIGFYNLVKHSLSLSR